VPPEPGEDPQLVVEGMTLILADIKDFNVVDQIYAAWLSGLGVTALPARTAFAVESLPAGALVMLDVIAAYPGD